MAWALGGDRRADPGCAKARRDAADAPGRPPEPSSRGVWNAVDYHFKPTKWRQTILKSVPSQPHHFGVGAQNRPKCTHISERRATGGVLWAFLLSEPLVSMIPRSALMWRGRIGPCGGPICAPWMPPLLAPVESIKTVTYVYIKLFYCGFLLHPAN